MILDVSDNREEEDRNKHGRVVVGKCKMTSSLLISNSIMELSTDDKKESSQSPNMCRRLLLLLLECMLVVRPEVSVGLIPHSSPAMVNIWGRGCVVDSEGAIQLSALRYSSDLAFQWLLLLGCSGLSTGFVDTPNNGRWCWCCCGCW
jgi:hypothetical protein